MKRLLWIAVSAIIVMAGFASADTQAQTEVEAHVYCQQGGRLMAGGQGRVTTYPNLPNRLRNAPGFSSSVIGHIPAGGVFSVTGRGACVDGIVWWPVNYRGVVGWTAEGDGSSQYWLEPLNINEPPPIQCTLASRLTVGLSGRVTPGLPNVVRSGPGVGIPSRIIGRIPAGGVFSVLQGPVCMPDGRLWWKVDYNGLVGWTAEGENRSYWLEPVRGVDRPHCPYALPSRLTIGAAAAVTSYPPLPNTVRAVPDSSGERLGQIPVDGVFVVLDGPVCNDYTAWWQVRYGNLIGWTGESDAQTYWLEPR